MGRNRTFTWAAQQHGQKPSGKGCSLYLVRPNPSFHHSAGVTSPGETIAKEGSQLRAAQAESCPLTELVVCSINPFLEGAAELGEASSKETSEEHKRRPIICLPYRKSLFGDALQQMEDGLLHVEELMGFHGQIAFNKAEGSQPRYSDTLKRERKGGTGRSISEQASLSKVMGHCSRRRGWTAAAWRALEAALSSGPHRLSLNCSLKNS